MGDGATQRQVHGDARLVEDVVNDTSATNNIRIEAILTASSSENNDRLGCGMICIASTSIIRRDDSYN